MIDSVAGRPCHVAGWRTKSGRPALHRGERSGSDALCFADDPASGAGPFCARLGRGRVICSTKAHSRGIDSITVRPCLVARWQPKSGRPALHRGERSGSDALCFADDPVSGAARFCVGEAKRPRPIVVRGLLRRDTDQPRIAVMAAVKEEGMGASIATSVPAGSRNSIRFAWSIRRGNPSWRLRSP